MIHVETPAMTPSGLKDFLNLPARLYREDPNWVAMPQKMQREQLLGEEGGRLGEHRFFVAYDDTRPVARVLAGVDQRLNERLGEKRGYLCLFESEPDMEYARAVLDAATAYLARRGMTRVVGPTFPGADDFNKGLLVEGFDGSPTLFNPYNPSFYPEYFEKYGFTKHRDHYAYLLNLEDFPAEHYRKLSDMAQKRFHFTVRHANLSRDNADALAADVARVVDEAFPSSWELTPPTKQDILREMHSLLRYTDSNLIVLAYAGERPVGLLVCFPDYNRLFRQMGGKLFPTGWLTLLLGRRKIDAVRCSMMFVSPDFQNKAVTIALALAAYEKAKEMGIHFAEASTIDETNVPSLLTTEHAGANRYRVYRQYELPLG